MISGPIVPDDVKLFKAWLVREPYTYVVKISSPGGSIEAAMEIGRLIRARFMRTKAYRLALNQERRCSVRDAIEHFQSFIPPRPYDDTSIKEQQAKCKTFTDCRVHDRCCLSACVLVLAGGASRSADNVGLHRPSLKDFSERSYEDARATLLKGLDSIERYLKEMEVPPAVFTAMMQAPPDGIMLLDEVAAAALFTGLSPEEAKVVFFTAQAFRTEHDMDIFYRLRARNPNPEMTVLAPSVYDWLRPRCTRDQDLDDWCVYLEMAKESVKRANRLSP